MANHSPVIKWNTGRIYPMLRVEMSAMYINEFSRPKRYLYSPHFCLSYEIIAAEHFELGIYNNKRTENKNDLRKV